MTTAPTCTGEILALLPEGTRIRHRRHPELTGSIKGLEWNARGVISPIPYLIDWDDSDAASSLLGWFFFYGDNETVERADNELRELLACRPTRLEVDANGKPTALILGSSLVDWPAPAAGEQE